MSSLRRAGIGGGAHMHGDLLVLAERGQQRDGDDRALALREIRARPDRAPGAFGDEGLEIRVELGHLRARPVHMGIAQHLAAHRHAGLVAFALVPLRQVRLLKMLLDECRSVVRLLDAGNVPCPVDDLEARAGNEIGRAACTRSGGVEPSWSPATQRVGTAIRPASGRQIRIADGRAGAGIAVSRRAHQHVAPARDFIRVASRETAA